VVLVAVGFKYVYTRDIFISQHNFYTIYLSLDLYQFYDTSEVKLKAIEIHRSIVELL